MSASCFPSRSALEPSATSLRNNQSPKTRKSSRRLRGMRHSKSESRRSSPSRRVLRRLMRCDHEHRRGSRDRGREVVKKIRSRDRTRKVIKQIPTVEVQFVEKHVNVHRDKYMSAHRCRAGRSGERLSVPAESAKKETDHPGAGQDPDPV